MSEPSLQDARETIDRLERRVEREREARRQSEEVADRSLRKLYSRQRALDLLTRSAAVSNSANDDRVAYEQVIQMIVRDYEWSVGHLLVTSRDDPQILVSSGIWVGDADDPFFARIKHATVGARFGPGVGIPGRVMVHGPRWESEPVDLVPSREPLLARGTVFAFGIMVESVLVAVMEFISPLPKPRDPDLLELATPMGEQLGRVMERKRAREQLEKHRGELERTVKERTSDLIKARDRAEALSRARNALFNTVTHELSTPVHAAMAALDTGDLGTARSQLTLLKQRIEALLAVANDSTRESTSKPEVCVLADAVTEICATQHALASPLGGSVVVSVDPSAAEEVLIDTQRLGNALDTLISGMRLATSSAPISVKVRLTGRQGIIEVRTPGTLPDEATVDVVRRLCEEAQGELSVRPDGQGLVFPVSRPRLRRVGVNRRVLLVDDTKVTQHLASLMLNDAGLDVDLAGDGVEAIERLREGQYGAVLMDIRMPRLDGLSATRQIRAGAAGPEKVDVPVIAMTAEAAPGAAETGLLAGFDAYLTKPFNKDALLTLVGRYLPEQ